VNGLRRDANSKHYIFEIYCTYGWRKSEPLETLKGRLADFAHRTITIENSENGDERIVVMTQNL
jgi:hypothetical protein